MVSSKYAALMIQVSNFFFFSSRRLHTRYWRDWSSDVCSSDLPRFDAVGRWLLELAGPDAVAEATVFTNVAPGSTEVVRPWVEALRNVGFAVFAKPKIDEDSDVDSDMLNHIALRRGEGLAGLLVA